MRANLSKIQIGGFKKYIIDGSGVPPVKLINNTSKVF
jgi:hypothetical protein